MSNDSPAIAGMSNGLLTGWRLAALLLLNLMALALLGWAKPHGPASPVKQQS